MKFHLSNRYVKWGTTILITFCTCLLFYYLLFHGANIKSLFSRAYGVLMPVFFGGIIAYLLTPTLNWIEKKFLFPFIEKIKVKDRKKAFRIVRCISIVITALFYYLIIQLIISMLLSQIIPSLQTLISNYDTYLNNFIAWLNELLSAYPQVADYVFDLIDRYSSELTTFLYDTVLVKSNELIKTLSMSVIGIIKVLWNFVLGFIISIYLLANKEIYGNQAKKIIYAIMKKESANVVLNNFRFAHNTFIGFIIGKVIDSIIIGFLCFAGTSILQTPFAALVSVVIGVTNVIPFFGPFLGAIPCSILILVVDPTHPLNFLYFVIFILFLQQLDGNFIGPKILGTSTGLSSFWVIFSITVFGGIMGVPGMIIGVPVFAIIYAAIKAFVNKSLINKDLPSQTEAYTNVECIDDDGIHIYDFSMTRQDPTFHSGSRYISGIDEWHYRYSKRQSERQTEKAEEAKQKEEKKP